VTSDLYAYLNSNEDVWCGAFWYEYGPTSMWATDLFTLSPTWSTPTGGTTTYASGDSANLPLLLPWLAGKSG
jgi:hypothetical protein